MNLQAARAFSNAGGYMKRGNLVFFIFYATLLLIFILLVSNLSAVTNTFTVYGDTYITGGYTGDISMNQACPSGVQNGTVASHCIYTWSKCTDGTRCTLQGSWGGWDCNGDYTQCNNGGIGCTDETIIGSCEMWSSGGWYCAVPGDTDHPSCSYHGGGYAQVFNYYAQSGSPPVCNQYVTTYSQTYDCASCSEGALINNGTSSVLCSESNINSGITDVNSCYDANSDRKIDYMSVSGGNINTVHNCPKTNSQLEINTDGTGRACVTSE